MKLLAGTYSCSSAFYSVECMYTGDLSTAESFLISSPSPPPAPFEQAIGAPADYSNLYIQLLWVVETSDCFPCSMNTWSKQRVVTNQNGVHGVSAFFEIKSPFSVVLCLFRQSFFSSLSLCLQDRHLLWTDLSRVDACTLTYFLSH